MAWKEAAGIVFLQYKSFLLHLAVERSDFGLAAVDKQQSRPEFKDAQKLRQKSTVSKRFKILLSSIFWNRLSFCVSLEIDFLAQSYTK